MRLLVFGQRSDTGFGVVTNELATRFVAKGIDVRVIAGNHRGEPVGGPLAGRIWPDYANGSAAEAIDGAMFAKFDATDRWKPDAVLVIADMSGLFGHMGGPAPTGPWLTVPIFHYCPIEGDNLSPAWADAWKQVIPIAMSNYGQRVISSYLDRAVPMIYHGVDTEMFRELTFADSVEFEGKRIKSKAGAKAAFGFDPDRTLILRSDRLVERKFYDRFIQAMIPVLEQSPTTDLVMHCHPTDGRLNLYEEIGRMPERLWKQLKLTGAHDTFRGLPREGLVTLMNAADLYVSTTGGEGFGLNLAESLACETPVVVTDWAAETEVVGPGGVVIPPLHDSYGDPVRYHSTYGMDWAVPDSKAFVQPVLDLLAKPARRRELGKAGRQHVIRSFSWDRAADQFLSFFEDVHAVAA